MDFIAGTTGERMPPTAKRVLVADDDEGVRTVVSWQLEAAGYEVNVATDGVRALAVLDDLPPDLVVLDLFLPGISGSDLLHRVRGGATASPVDLPVIVLSGRDAQSDRIGGLDQGADDYLVKPFSPSELEARVRSLLRRSRPDHRSGTPRAAAQAEIVIGAIRVDPASRSVEVSGDRAELTAMEFDLLYFLAANPRHAFTRAQLLAQVWPSSTGHQGEATVTEHVHRLRQKLEADPARPSLLHTVRGVGYQLEPDS